MSSGLVGTGREVRAGSCQSTLLAVPDDYIVEVSRVMLSATGINNRRPLCQRTALGLRGSCAGRSMVSASRLRLQMAGRLHLCECCIAGQTLGKTTLRGLP